MGTIADKLAKLNTTKEELKAAINGSGNTVGDVFSAYPAAITSGKTAIAQAITAKGVDTAANATFQQMATNIGEISSSTLLEEIDQYNFCYCIANKVPTFICVNNYGIIPIVGALDGINYSGALINNEYVFYVNSYGDEYIEVSLESDSMDIYFRTDDVFYGNNIFSEENVKFFMSEKTKL